MLATDAKRILTAKIVDDGAHSRIGTNLHQPRLRGLRLRRGTVCVTLRKERLSLQIRTIDDIAINDRDCSYARSNELLTHHGPKCAATRNQHLRRTEATLPRFAESGESHLTGETVEGVLHGARVAEALPVRLSVAAGFDVSAATARNMQRPSADPPNPHNKRPHETPTRNARETPPAAHGASHATPTA